MFIFGLGGLFYSEYILSVPTQHFTNTHTQSSSSLPMPLRFSRKTASSQEVRTPSPPNAKHRTAPSIPPKAIQPSHALHTQSANPCCSSWLDSFSSRTQFRRPTRRREYKGAADQPGVLGTDTDAKYVFPTRNSSECVASKKQDVSSYQANACAVPLMVINTLMIIYLLILG
jgi:hypothetical protein